jgi:protein SCO1/2
VGGATVWYYQADKERRKNDAVARNTTSVGKPAIGGQWTLVDHTGRPVTDASLKEGGHTHALLYFGFT